MVAQPTRAFAERVRKHEPLIGTMLALPSPEIAEIAVEAGFDWLFIDLEHGLLDFTAAQRMIQAAGPCPSVVRVPANEPIWIAKALDTGAAGVIVPHVETAGDAHRMIRAGRYPPAGIRSVGLARAQGFGSRLQASIDHDNEAVILVPQAEHIGAARHIEEIVRTPGGDAIFIGPFDLAGSLGKPGRIGDPEVQAAVHLIRDACRAAGVASGIFVVDAEAARQAVAEGYSLICVAADTLMLARAAAEVVKRSRA